MAKAIVDPNELRRFAADLKKFNNDVQTQMTRVTAPINLLQEANGAAVVIGTVQCSQASPCWQLPVTKLAADRIKPTSVVVQSSKGGSATALATNGPGF